jgi:hypothetical protein
MGTQQTQSMKRARHPEFIVMRECEVIPVAPAVPATVGSVEAAIVGSGKCDDNGVLCMTALCCCVV